MIKCYTLDGEFYKEEICFGNFHEIKNRLKSNSQFISSMPVEAIVLIMNEYSKKLSLNKEALSIEGVPFLSFYLKKNNVKKLIRLNLGNEEYLDNFLEVEEGKYMKAQPRGVVCHWVAGNVATLAIYSAFQGLLCKNANLLRIPKKSIHEVMKLLRLLDNIDVDYKGNVYSSKSLLKNISIIYFDSKDIKLNSSMSLEADARVVWGGKQAVDAITALPKKTTCKDLIFGPKYSFSVFDKSAIESCDIERYLENLVSDIIAFDQKACSSPQVLFIERSCMSLEEIGCKLANSFEKISKRYPNNNIEQYIAAKIINKRGEYGLSLEKTLYSSKGLDFTILIDREVKLEEPVQGRTIFLKEVESIFEVTKLITSKIQCIGVASKDKEKILKFADGVTKLGVDRVTQIGFMNFYDFPWDGSLVLSELVRWCSLNIKGMIS
ncbi:acyl-CoA reductase [Clostridium ganghwense]|uniref:Acyl-CoA reductase n=1 Tax=Clostridium ganghwense TaxID=312089 RepID=A0ABT4CSA0_9CLOT|nr:acyl-CoA reductase [Clostridium ganghwense]MCY6371922.1 acyl-CoA reductase [Clostridium ganghwense]